MPTCLEEGRASATGHGGRLSIRLCPAFQLTVNKWHAWLDDPTIADAILDRIVHCSHRVALKGPSLRKSEVPGEEPEQ